jgi:hypothetical protein
MKTEISKMMTARKRELRTVSRSFPKFTPGMTVAAYCERYRLLNGHAAHVLPFDWDALQHPAAVLDASTPEVIEETAPCTH